MDERRTRLRETLERYAQTRDPAIRDEVVSAYQGLAYSIAARYGQRGEDLDDLNQVALIGLLKAVTRFDPERRIELTTFATITITGELKRHLRDRSWWVRVPRRVHDLHLRSLQAVDELTQELGRSPTMTEVAARVGRSPEDVVEALEAGSLRRLASLEAPSGRRDERPVTERRGEADGQLAEADERLAFAPLLGRLPPRQQEILRLRFAAGLSQSEIAVRVGVSQMQVSRLLARSLQQLRAWSAGG